MTTALPSSSCVFERRLSPGLHEHSLRHILSTLHTARPHRRASFALPHAVSAQEVGRRFASRRCRAWLDLRTISGSRGVPRKFYVRMYIRRLISTSTSVPSSRVHGDVSSAVRPTLSHITTMRCPHDLVLTLFHSDRNYNT